MYNIFKYFNGVNKKKRCWEIFRGVPIVSLFKKIKKNKWKSKTGSSQHWTQPTTGSRNSTLMGLRLSLKRPGRKLHFAVLTNDTRRAHRWVLRIKHGLQNCFVWVDYTWLLILYMNGFGPRPRSSIQIIWVLANLSCMKPWIVRFHYFLLLVVTPDKLSIFDLCGRPNEARITIVWTILLIRFNSEGSQLSYTKWSKCLISFMGKTPTLRDLIAKMVLWKKHLWFSRLACLPC